MVPKNVLCDARRLLGGRTRFRDKLHIVIAHRGFTATCLFRLAAAMENADIPLLPALVSSISVTITGADIAPNASIGEGLILHHPVGIVIGSGVTIGRNCTILQNVTLGEKYGPDGGHLYPQIGDGVTICCGAVIVGGVTVGDGATIGANAVVLSDVAAGSTMVGVPARPLHPSR